MVDYSYQDGLISQVCEAMTYKKKVVLAACPGAGKTVMTTRIIERFLKTHPNGKILVLTHGQTVLRSQWRDQMRKFSKIQVTEIADRLSITGKRTTINPDVNVFLALPHSRRLIKKYLDRIDLLIVDEAHHFFNGDLINELKEHLKPTFQLLLTGTPSPYIGKDDYEIIGITIQELIPYGTLTDPQIQLMKSDYPIKLSDYNENYTLKDAVTLDNKSTLSSFQKVLKEMHTRLGKDLGKTMIVCHSQKQALAVYHYLDTLYPTLLSISDQRVHRRKLHKDRNSQSIEVFKQDPKYKFLIVVNRGILGFDYPALLNLIDMTQTLNVNRLFQMLCRVVRQHPDGPQKKKLFIKICPQELTSYSYLVMSFTVSLSDPRYYFKYNAKDARLFNHMEFPIKREVISLLERIEEPKTRNSYNFERLPQLMTFTEIKEESTSPLTIYAKTNFRTVKKMLGISQGWTIELALNEARKYKNRVEFGRKSQAAYHYLIFHEDPLALKLLEEVLPYTRDVFKFHPERAQEIIERGNLQEIKETGVYKYLSGRKELHRIAHLIPEKMNLEKALTLARTCKSYPEFRKTYKAAYSYLKVNYKLKFLYEIHPIKKPITQKELDLVSQYRLEGLSAMDSCKKAGITYQTWYARTHRKDRQGTTPLLDKDYGRGKREPLNYGHVDKVRSLVKKGNSISKACKKVGLSPSTYYHAKTRLQEEGKW